MLTKRRHKQIKSTLYAQLINNTNILKKVLLQPKRKTSHDLHFNCKIAYRERITNWCLLEGAISQSRAWNETINSKIDLSWAVSVCLHTVVVGETEECVHRKVRELFWCLWFKNGCFEMIPKLMTELILLIYRQFYTVK